MSLVNEEFLKLPGSYLFSDIAKKVNTFKITHPKEDVIRLGIGDVTRPLPAASIEAMHKAVNDMTSKRTFHGILLLLRSSKTIPFAFLLSLLPIPANRWTTKLLCSKPYVR